MKIGIVGLGLIGGSLAKAFKKNEVFVYGADKDIEVMEEALMDGAIDDYLTDETIPDCHMILVATPSAAGISWLKNNAHKMRKTQPVVDCCGTKRGICEIGFELSKSTNMCFVGGHPMAGFNVDGYANSRADLFRHATFVICQDGDDMFLSRMVCNFLSNAGFTKFAFMSPFDHDKTIAFTSQLSHIVPSALVKSGNASFDGLPIAGGSFRDMTRVAYLNEKAWTELCMDNRDNLIEEIDAFIDELVQYRSALMSGDYRELKKLFAEGSRTKEEIDKAIGA